MKTQQHTDPAATATADAILGRAKEAVIQVAEDLADISDHHGLDLKASCVVVLDPSFGTYAGTLALATRHVVETLDDGTAILVCDRATAVAALTQAGLHPDGGDVFAGAGRDELPVVVLFETTGAYTTIVPDREPAEASRAN